MIVCSVVYAWYKMGLVLLAINDYRRLIMSVSSLQTNVVTVSFHQWYLTPKLQVAKIVLGLSVAYLVWVKLN